MRDTAPQPKNISVHKLNRFFGQHLDIEKKENDSTSDEDQFESEEIFAEKRNRSNFKAKKVLCEVSLDNNQESQTRNYAPQPDHVTSSKLAAIFGEDIPEGTSNRSSVLDPSTRKVNEFFGEESEAHRLQ